MSTVAMRTRGHVAAVEPNDPAKCASLLDTLAARCDAPEHRQTRNAFVPTSANDNIMPPLAYEAVIKKAIADWTSLQPRLLLIRMEDSAMCSLAFLITRRLVHAGLIVDDEARER